MNILLMKRVLHRARIIIAFMAIILTSVEAHETRKFELHVWMNRYTTTEIEKVYEVDGKTKVYFDGRFFTELETVDKRVTPFCYAKPIGEGQQLSMKPLTSSSVMIKYDASVMLSRIKEILEGEKYSCGVERTPIMDYKPFSEEIDLIVDSPITLKIENTYIKLLLLKKG